MTGILASGSTAPNLSGFLGGITELLTWTLSSITSIVNWILGNPLAFVYLGMFIVGFAAAFLFRILRSV